MRHSRFIIALAVTASSACHPALNVDAPQSAAALPGAVQPGFADPVGSQAGSEATASAALSANYASARTALLEAGWLPLRDPGCWTNVGGRAEVCNVLPETEACSSEGHCVMHFGHLARAKTVRMTTYGDWTRWNLPGGDGMQVKSLQEAELTGAPGGTCPASSFDGFLLAFATDEATRIAFTAPLVRVVELNSTNEGDFPREVLVRGDAYAAFNVRYAGGTFHHVDAAGRVDPAPLPLDVKRVGTAYEVRYRYGMSEGNSYVFEAHAGCWRLAADPEPPTP